ncbi:hypothetical protein GKQ38_02085 [Candidatus Nanohaloarchaea archaeon]|nr:hypothetical protein GKQ38_02085 [Candidatus Nanohaloarchaea archaeon]
MKTVIHLSSNNSNKIAEAVANTRNLLRDETVKESEIVLLVNSDAINSLESGSAAEAISRTF